MAELAATIRVEVAWALPRQQLLRVVELPAGSTVGEAIAASGIERDCGIDARTLAVGIWSRRVTLDTALVEGDRIEIYRPLRIDPRQARRLRAQRQRGR